MILEEGSVLVDYATAGNRDSILMKPGERIQYDTMTKSLASEQLAVKPILAWKDGSLVFQNQRLEDVTKRLQEIFGTEIVLADQEMRDRLVHLSTSADDLNVFFSTLDQLSPRKLIVDRSTDTIRLSEGPE